ncbi:hypothetical protein LTSEINV_6560 [Salmonella enterica subsp. enterica serovar Inverness str. R8-3668]|uniref:Uncharacterized protein n=2 Tax=Salmonella enterica I TaxID=59201 RepID=G5S0N1_SALET|nr:hypothetical protein LTSEINV_6560 [Salmonella enterica subsp. enterica serovar Inverness str. R8-3668]EHC99673.1 hypothetical protein LTSEURB_4733 [Salmonella enterica subsp. enterica serovar Urbana str. R8-2977]
MAVLMAALTAGKLPAVSIRLSATGRNRFDIVLMGFPPADMFWPM